MNSREKWARKTMKTVKKYTQYISCMYMCVCVCLCVCVLNSENILSPEPYHVRNGNNNNEHIRNKSQVTNITYCCGRNWRWGHRKSCMICWPCIIAHQYSETNVMHFRFNVLSISGLYMFRTLRAHPQDSLNKRHLIYSVRFFNHLAAHGLKWNFNPGGANW
jgi:hypothetical protein